MENLKIDDFIHYKFLSDPNYSPDGDKICFIQKEADLENNSYKSYLWLYKPLDGIHFKLTTVGEESSYLWLDNENIIFSAIRDKKDKERKEKGEIFTVFYKISIFGGEAEKFFEIPKQVTSIKVLNSKEFIYTAQFDFNIKDLDALDDKEKEEEYKRRKEEKDYEVLEEIPFWGNGQGFTSMKRNHMYRFNLDTGKSSEIINEYKNVEFISISEDKHLAVMIVREFKDKMETRNDVYIYDIINDKYEKITPSTKFSYGSAYFIDSNKLIVSGSDMQLYGLNQNPKFYILDINSKEKKCITPDFDASLWSAVGSDCRLGGGLSIKKDNSHIYFVSTSSFSSYLYSMDFHGNIKQIIDTEGSVDSYDVKNGNIVFIGLRGNHLQELYEITGNEEIPVTSFNREILKNKKLSTPEYIRVETASDVFIDGWIMKPVDFDENKTYPGLLNIHGGPKTVYGSIFYHEMQYWANEGYVVFFCNPRGSDGRGNEFADIRGKYGTIDYNDLMMFTDYVADNYPFVDKKRLVETGGSYGGFMTNWIIGHTDRFKAAASQRSISNWIGKFCTTDIGYYFNSDQIKATPWEDYDKLWNHSPLKFADRARTPTLFIHSEEDYRCWLPEGLSMFTALKYHGVEARMCMFRGENHELSRGGKPKHRIRRLREITDWFNKYVK